MILKELVKHLRLYILDDGGGADIDWSSITEEDDEAEQLRWTNEELTSHINEALKQAHRGILDLKGYNSSFDIRLKPSTYSYQYDSRIVDIIDIRLSSTGSSLIKTDLSDIISYPNWDTEEGTPKFWYYGETIGKVCVYPVPRESDTLKIISYRDELVKLSWDSNGLSPELDERYQVDMLNYAAFLAYMKDEPNSLDPKKAEKHLGLFKSEFSSNSAYVIGRRRRTASPTTTYGGISFSTRFN